MQTAQNLLTDTLELHDNFTQMFNKKNLIYFPSQFIYFSFKLKIKFYNNEIIKFSISIKKNFY